MKIVEVLLLAAGMGTRLRPITDNLPKCLVPIGGKPLLWYWLNIFKNSKNIEKILINTHYLNDKVEKYLSSIKHKFPFEIKTYYEKDLLGTAGTINKLSTNLNEDGDLLLAYADNLTKFDLTEFASAHYHRPAGSEITMMIFETDSPSDCGIVELDSNGLLINFHEKVNNPPSNLANAAVFMISPNALKEIKTIDHAYDFSKDVVPHFLGRIFTWMNSTYHRDIGTPSSYCKAKVEFLELFIK